MTKQELQQKIYESGFSAPYYETNSGAIHGEFLFHGKYVDEELVKARDNGLFTPHYPCEWLWKRLPKEMSFWYLSAFNEATQLGYIFIGNDGEIDIDYSIPINNDLHQALLELFVWTIEEGHVKP